MGYIRNIFWLIQISLKSTPGWLCIYVCMNVCMHVCMWLCGWVGGWVFTKKKFVKAYAYEDVHIHAHVQVHVLHMHMPLHVHIRMHTFVHKCIDIHILSLCLHNSMYLHMFMHIHMPTYMHTASPQFQRKYRVGQRTHEYTCIQTYIRTCMCACIHKHTQLCVRICICIYIYMICVPTSIRNTITTLATSKYDSNKVMKLKDKQRKA